MAPKLPQKCPICNSTRLDGNPKRFVCLKCGYSYGPKSMSFQTADTLRKLP